MTDGNQPSEAPVSGRAEAVQRKLDAVRAHAHDLLDAARRSFDGSLPHIAFHLGILAMEELGKAVLVMASQGLVDLDPDEAERWERQTASHAKKLFWALWAPLGIERREVITVEQMQEYRRIATLLHSKRLSALYVEPDLATLTLPREAVSSAEVEGLLRMVESHLAIADLIEVGNPSEERRSVFGWMLLAMEDESKAALLFGQKSLEKRAELGNPVKWMMWLKEQFDEAERESQQLLAAELRREIPNAAENVTPRWVVAVRVHTNSHSIRAKEFKWWNDGSPFIKLRDVSSKNEFRAEFSLPDTVRIDRLWDSGWNFVHHFLVALNIGAMGFFWWEVPKRATRYYERIRDLHTGKDVVVQGEPATVEWGKHVLRQEDLRNVSVCVSMLPHSDDAEAFAICQEYAGGLRVLAKTDLFFRVEATALRHFMRALAVAHDVYGYRLPGESSSEAFARWWLELTEDNEALPRQSDLFGRAERDDFAGTQVSLEEAAGAKTICDAYLQGAFRERMATRIAFERKDASPI